MTAPTQQGNRPLEPVLEDSPNTPTLEQLDELLQANDGIHQQTRSRLVYLATLDFAAWLTTRPEVVPIGASADAAPMVELLKQWREERGVPDHEVLMDDLEAWPDYVGEW